MQIQVSSFSELQLNGGRRAKFFFFIFLGALDSALEKYLDARKRCDFSWITYKGLQQQSKNL